MIPTFDRDGYPSTATTNYIEDYSDWENPKELFDFAADAWNDTYGKVTITHGKKTYYRFVTGGWSGNEDIIYALQENVIAISHWFSSVRGGLHIYLLEEK